MMKYNKCKFICEFSGSCSYDDNGLKNGKCIDFDQNFFL